jgi:hypothetical protein
MQIFLKNYKNLHTFPLKNFAFLSYTLEKSDFLCNFAFRCRKKTS